MSSLPFHLRDELKRSGKIFDLVRVFHFYIRVHNHQKSIRKEKKKNNKPTNKKRMERKLLVYNSVCHWEAWCRFQNDNIQSKAVCFCVIDICKIRTPKWSEQRENGTSDFSVAACTKGEFAVYILLSICATKNWWNVAFCSNQMQENNRRI